MSYAIAPITPPGARVISAANDLIETFQARADAADRANEVCAANYADLQRTGIAAAFVPEELNGMGLRSLHDMTLLIATLARGDGSTAIGISMHLSQTRGMASRYRASKSGSAAHQRAQTFLEAVAKGEMLMCSTTTERGTDNLRPNSEAVRHGDGWRVNGAKDFVTMSPVATHIAANVRMSDEDGEHIANVLMPMDTPGVQPQGNWDALGMRASGSQSIKFENCLLPHDALRKVGPWGTWSIPLLFHRTVANVPLVGASLGIAETAFQYALDGALAAQDDNMRPGVHHALAEMEISLATSQSILARLGTRLDELMAETNDGADMTYEQGHEIMKDYQSAKWVVNRQAIDIVIQAMDLSGGGGFLARNPLSRLYRDVRAGSFMKPYSPIDAREYMGRVLLGAYPEN